MPFIWFPWYGKFDLEKLKADVLQEFLEIEEYAENEPPTPREAFGGITDIECDNYLKEEKKRRRAPRNTWMREEIKSRTPDAIVIHGDSITTHLRL